MANAEAQDASLSHKFTQNYSLVTTSKPYPGCVLVNSNRWRIRWDMLIITLALYSSIATPFTVSFQTDDSYLAYDIWEYFVTAFFVVDIAVTFRSSFMDKEGNEVVDPRIIAKQYIYSGLFFLDLVASFPFEIISSNGAGSSHLGLLRMLKLVRLLRMRRIIVYLKFNTDFKLALKILFIIFCTFLFVHICACFWNLVVIQDKDWRPESSDYDRYYESDERTYQYAVALYYTTFMVLGADSFPHSTPEGVYAFVVSFLGVVVLSSLFGHMALLVQSLSRKNDALHEQLDKAGIAMKHIKLSKKTSGKVSNFILNTFSDRDKQEEINHFFTMLSPSLRLEASSFLYSSMLNENGIFARQAEIVSFIIPRLKTYVTNPESIVFETGSLGTHWYYVGKGELQILTLNKNGDNIISNVVIPGDYFGEISLLVGCRHTATIRAKTYCNLAFLTKDFFIEMIDVFPSVKAEFMEKVFSYHDEWREHVTDMLNSVPYFHGLTQKQLSFLSYHFSIQHLETGNEIIRRGAAVKSLVFIATGGCHVLVERRRKPKFSILKLNRGSVCFINSALRDLPALFTLETSTKSIILSLPIDVLRTLGNYIPQLTTRVSVAQGKIQTEGFPESHDFFVTSAFERGKKNLHFRQTIIKLIHLFQNKQARRKEFKMANVVESALKLEMMKLATQKHEGDALKEEYERRATELLTAGKSMIAQVAELEQVLLSQEKELEVLERALEAKLAKRQA
jgi:CRP-like cAMP-binding protein